MASIGTCNLLNIKISSCFYEITEATHNRLVAGSSPAGATKFSDENHAVKPPFKGGFFVCVGQCRKSVALFYEG